MQIRTNTTSTTLMCTHTHTYIPCGPDGLGVGTAGGGEAAWYTKELDGPARFGATGMEELRVDEIETPTLDVIEHDGMAELEPAKIAIGSVRREHAEREESGKKCMGNLYVYQLCTQHPNTHMQYVYACNKQ